MNWKKWLDNRSIKPVSTGKEQAPRLLKSAKEQISDGEKVLAIKTFSVARDQAYEAMLKAGMALILSYGYRPESGSHHLITVKIVAKLLGDRHKGVMKAFNDLRKSRNERLYKGHEYCTKSDAERALSQAIKLSDIVEKDIS